MIINIYAIKDELNGFTTAIPFPNDETAKRYFREQKKENLSVKITPEDYSIWKLGEFDNETGETKNNVQLLERG